MTFKERYERLKNFIKGTADEHISAFAAQTAFFLFLAFFPLVSLIMSLSAFLPITQNQLIELICNVLPARFEDYVISIVNDIYEGRSYTMTIVSAGIALWSAAKGLLALRLGLNEVYRSREQRNYLIIRGISSAYTALFLVMLVFMIPLNMFGTQIALFVINKFPDFDNVTMLVLGLRTLATFIILFLFFWMLYTIVPTRRLKAIRQIPGAVFTAGAWILITKIMSLYIDQFMTNSYMYGSLTMVILIMLWLYSVSCMIFIGAQINEYLYIIKYKDEDRAIAEKKAAAKRARREAREARRQEKIERKSAGKKKKLGELEEPGETFNPAFTENEKTDTLINEVTDEVVVTFDTIKEQREKRRLKKISDEEDEHFIDDDIATR